MGFFNKCVMLGNITRNPEIRHIPGSGNAVGRMGLAVTRRYKHNNETKEEVCFIDIVAFGRTAEFMGEYLAKGIPVLVEGRLAFNQWEQDGVKRSKHEIIAENIQLVERKNAEGAPITSDGPPIQNYNQADTIDEDDIPF